MAVIHPHFEIRPARLKDAGDLAVLLRSVGWFSVIETQSELETEAQVRKQLAACLEQSGHSIYIARSEEGALWGYVSVHWLPYLFLPGPEGFISELFVAGTARGRGVGSALLQHVRAEAIRRGCYRLSLLNGRQRESYRRKFYTKQGWEERENMVNFVSWLEAV